MTAAPLQRTSTVEALAAALRERILDGDLPGGTRLREQELTDGYGVARHTVRAALRTLAVDGLVRIEPNRGAAVTELGPHDVLGLYELRTALEVEAARLALERHDGRLPPPVYDAVAGLSAVCAQPSPSWGAMIAAHDPIHAAIVGAAQSPRISRAHAALNTETRLFLVGLKPSWTPERMAKDHEALPRDIEARGPDALRAHLTEAAAAVLSRSPGAR